jgi:ribose transport system permease protein
VIGGVSLFGGVGTVAGTLLGLAIMQVIRAGLVSTNVNTHWQTVAVGVIMILAVGVDLLRRRAKIHA